MDGLNGWCIEGGLIWDPDVLFHFCPILDVLYLDFIHCGRVKHKREEA
jgi:hypothetical protein